MFYLSSFIETFSENEPFVILPRQLVDFQMSHMSAPHFSVFFLHLEFRQDEPLSREHDISNRFGITAISLNVRHKTVQISSEKPDEETAAAGSQFDAYSAEEIAKISSTMVCVLPSIWFVVMINTKPCAHLP